jgi:hypothetical protein
MHWSQSNQQRNSCFSEHGRGYDRAQNPAISVITDADRRPIEAALKYLNKFDTDRNLLTIEHRITLVEKIIPTVAANFVINAAMRFIKFNTAAIIRSPRIRDIFATKRPQSMREKVLRMQLKFFSEGGRFEVTDADLIRLVTDQKDAAMTFDPIFCGLETNADIIFRRSRDHQQ